jgi:uncharacterized protein (TIGR02678 family)
MRSNRATLSLSELQQRKQRDEFRIALRALLMQPLMGPTHDAFQAVRRQAEPLREWFARETGWALQVQRDGARLYKRPAELDDATRGIPDYNRHRYVLLCLACAVLERSDPQITLRVLGERLLTLSADPTLTALGFRFTLRTPAERRDLVAVCGTLMELEVLQRVAGDEEQFVRSSEAQGDALYDVHRRALSGMLAAARGPSAWSPEEAPASLDARLQAMSAEHVVDSDEGRRTALRHRLARRLLDDPVVYTHSLDPDSLAYFMNQRGAMAARLCQATGLTAEQRAEGLALTDETGNLTDVLMPSEGTDSHATLLVAEHLAELARTRPAHEATATESAIAGFLGGIRGQYGRFWRKSAREPGSESELAAIALDRLQKLQLIVREGDVVRPLPAIARFALGETELQPASARNPNTSFRS